VLDEELLGELARQACGDGIVVVGVLALEVPAHADGELAVQPGLGLLVQALQREDARIRRQHHDIGDDLLSARVRLELVARVVVEVLDECGEARAVGVGCEAVVEEAELT